MLSLLLRRAGLAVMVAITVSMLCFVLSNVAVDPALALAGESATEADLQALRVRYGLDRPLPVRYVAYLARLVQGDLGTSQLTGEPVGQMLADRVGVTATLALSAILLALAIAVPAGVLAAAHRGGWADRFVSLVTVVVQVVQEIPGEGVDRERCAVRAPAGPPPLITGHLAERFGHRIGVRP